MEFMNRDARTPQPAASTGNAPHSGNNGSGRGKRRGFSALNFAFVALLFSATVVIVLLVLLLARTGLSKESNNIDEGKMQAVFLNGGQVYFGRIQDLNSKYLRVNDIYYLRVSQTVQPDDKKQAANPELVKLGCELHGPQDEMIINREQVLFWENLKDKGKVADAVKRYKEQYPNGRDCDEVNKTESTTGNSQ